MEYELVKEFYGERIVANPRRIRAADGLIGNNRGSIAAYPFEKLRLMVQSKSYGIIALYIKLSSRRCQLTVKVLAYPIVNYIAVISGITLKVRI